MGRVVGPRRITRLRRVTLPVALRRETRMRAGAWVEVVLLGGEGRLAVRPASPPASGARRTGRPRRVTGGGQVTLPAHLMRRVGLEVGDCVYLLVEPGGRDSIAVVAGEDVLVSGWDEEVLR